jgi:hypothetical protein
LFSLQGYLAYPTTAVAEGVLLPGVVILPDADGLEGVRNTPSSTLLSVAAHW